MQCAKTVNKCYEKVSKQEVNLGGKTICIGLQHLIKQFATLKETRRTYMESSGATQLAIFDRSV